jgi:hypothetical protein
MPKGNESTTLAIYLIFDWIFLVRIARTRIEHKVYRVLL